MAGAAISVVLTLPAIVLAQTPVAPGPLTVQVGQPGPVINRDIFGQMSEHLGQGIYNGIWVGKDSKIPNVRGIRSDVVSALRAIKVPVVRWPGGCFADNYNWRDGVGPSDKRPVTLNANWGLLEPNAFGTNEFMDFANQIGAAAYVAVNISTGSVQQASDWLEYMTVDKPTTLEKERASDGHPAPYEVKYIGMGNEMSGCGGAMSPSDYVEHLKLYASNVDSRNPDQAPASLLRQRGPHAAMRVADGTDDDYIDAVMRAWQGHQSWSWSIEGLSLHHYTWGGAAMSSPSTGFGEQQYAGLLKETMEMEGLIAQRSALMDKYDPKKSVALIVDEWGVWLKPLPGTNPLFLRQQNSLRDAIAASLNLNIFARHADRVRMTNIAQMVNVLQSMILTDNAKMVLTPTYYVYKMYVPFQDAQFIPISFQGGLYTFGNITLPQVDAIAARGKDGKIWLALTNLDPDHDVDITIDVAGAPAQAAVGQVLTAARVDAVNTFDAPPEVMPKPVITQAVDGKLVLHLPSKSVTVVFLQP